MNEKEHRQTGVKSEEPTEAERILGSMPEFGEKSHETSNEEKEHELRVSKIVELLDDEEEYTRQQEEEEEALFDTEDKYEFADFSSLSGRMLKTIRKQISQLDKNSQEYIEAKEIMKDTHEVREAIDNTITYLGEYFNKTCRQRLEDGVGSIYDGIYSVDTMENVLRMAHWKKAQHPDVMPGCQAYKTKDIKGGHLGLLSIAELPNDVTITASDPKGTGKVSMTVTGEKGPEVEETWLIVGDEGGHDVVYTFHPGEPVRPSIVEVKDCPDGTKLTKEQAIALGFDLAKIV